MLEGNEVRWRCQRGMRCGGGVRRNEVRRRCQRGMRCGGGVRGE